MQLTIDSAEPLERVLAVVGALYNVELTLPDPPVAKATRARPVKAKARETPPGMTGRRSRDATTRPARRASATKPAAVREWAKANGHAVSDRGRVPAAVTAAYIAAGAPTD